MGKPIPVEEDGRASRAAEGRNPDALPYHQALKYDKLKHIESEQAAPG